MLDTITYNPFRILGVYSNCKQTEIVRNMGKLKAFISVGKNCEFLTDFNNILPRLNRSIDIVQNAFSAITLPIDRMHHALFWFCIADDNDSNALAYLANDELGKAYEVLSSKTTFSSLLNIGVLGMIQEDVNKAVDSYTALIHNKTYLSQFRDAVCDETVDVSEEALSHILIEELCTCRIIKRHLSIFSNTADFEYAKEIAAKESLSIINTAIAKAKNVSPQDPVASYKAGEILIQETKNALSELRTILTEDDSLYQSTSDNLAKQILQCGINYYNNSNDYDRAKQAAGLQKYALDLAQGKLIKDRCQKNYDILLKAIDELPPESISQEVSSIMSAIKEFVSKPDLIKHSLNLVQTCSAHLKKIETSLGKKNESYLKYATLVANNAIHNVIEEVNHAQSQLSDENIDLITMRRMAEKRRDDYDDPFGRLSLGGLYSRTSILDSEDFVRRTVRYELLADYREVLSQAWLVIKHLDKFSYEDSFYKERYLPNKTTLRKLCKQVGADMRHNKYSYLEFHPLDEDFNFDEPFGVVQGILCGLVWLACIVMPIVLVLSGREDGSIGGAIVGGLLGGGFGGAIAAGLFSYVIIIVTDIGIALINFVLWIMNQFSKNV